MNKVWLLLIWFSFAAVESITYSLVKYIEAREDCVARDTNADWKTMYQFLDVTINYQSWFIPMIWLYWPTKKRKKENRSRKRAMD